MNAKKGIIFVFMVRKMINRISNDGDRYVLKILTSSYFFPIMGEGGRRGEGHWGYGPPFNHQRGANISFGPLSLATL